MGGSASFEKPAKAKVQSEKQDRDAGRTDSEHGLPVQPNRLLRLGALLRVNIYGSVSHGSRPVLAVHAVVIATVMSIAFITMVVGIAPKAGAFGRRGKPALPAEAAGTIPADTHYRVVEPKLREIEQAIDDVVAFLGAVVHELAITAFVGDEERRRLAGGEITWELDIDLGAIIKRADRTPAWLVAFDRVVEIQLIEGHAGNYGVGIAVIRSVDRRDLARQAVERIGPSDRGVIGGTSMAAGLEQIDSPVCGDHQIGAELGLVGLTKSKV